MTMLLMRASVRAAVVGFTKGLEGSESHMYLDVGADSGRGRGLVTSAIGDLMPLADAVTRPFMRPDGTPATREEIAAEWAYVDSRQDMRKLGGGAFAAITKLRLTPEGISGIVLDKLAQIDAFMGQRFPSYAQWPAAGQLLVLSMSWAAGAGFVAPKFSRAVNALDFATAAIECHLDDAQNPGLKPRNVDDRLLALEAEAVLAGGGDPEVLWYPKPFGAAAAIPDAEIPVVGEDDRPIFIPPSEPPTEAA